MDNAAFERFLAGLPRERTQLLPALLAAQAALGHVPDAAVERIAAHLRLTVNDVEGVATSYPELRREPTGQRVVQVCTGLACWAGGSSRLLAALESALGIRAGETTPDGGVTLEEASCRFLCAEAPVLELDGVCSGRVGEDRMAKVLLQAQYEPRPGASGPESRRGGMQARQRAERRVGRLRPADGEPEGAALVLDGLVASARRRLGRRWQRQPVRVLVGTGGCCQAVGANEVAAALRGEMSARGLSVPVVEAGCTGMCFQDVQVTLQRPNRPDVTYGRVRAGEASKLLDVVVGDHSVATVPDAFAWSPEPVDGLPGLSQVSFLAGQRRVLLEHVGRVEPTDVDEALQRGAYRGLARALSVAPESVVELVKRAGLAGRGGAYFPLALKWEACLRAGPAPRYLVVNAEEGEPGVFKDRHLLEGDPHRVLEGVLIAAYALGAERVFVYLNGLAHTARQRLEAALAGARARGLLGDAILGTAFACDIETRAGGGGYVLGEETVLLESIEGRRAMPRVRPPYPTEAGLWERPTSINNAESLANVAVILDRGPDWFAGLGTSRWPGTKLLSISGDVACPGLVEVEMGTSLRRVLVDVAGGVPGGRALQAVLTGGPSGNLVPADRLDTPLEPKLADVLLGSGNLVVLDETRPLLEAVRRLTRFNGEESCGKCTPCREGVNRMREILDRMAAGQGRASDRDDLLSLAEIAASASICGLGQMAPNPVLSALRHFAVPAAES